MARGGRGAEDLVNPTGGMCLTPRSRGSGATVWEALEPVVRRRIRSPEDTCVCPEGQGARTQKCPAVAQSCRVSGRRPRVSETCDRSSLETRINYSLHRLFTSPTAADGVDRQRVTVRGSGFGVRGVAARRRGGPGPIHGREVLVVTSRTHGRTFGTMAMTVSACLIVSTCVIVPSIARLFRPSLYFRRTIESQTSSRIYR